MDHQPSPATSRGWRPKDGPQSLFGGKLVNKKRLCSADMLGCSVSTLNGYMRKGMPFIKVGQRYFFDPDACVAWFRSKQQPRLESGVRLIKGD